MGTLHDLSQSECRGLLADRRVGRVGLVAPDGPHIIPVNYAVVDETIVLRTSPFSLLALHGRDAVLAFEVDSTDEAREAGWSVLVRGRSSAVDDTREIEHIKRVWEPDPWADGTRNLYLRLKIDQLSGRRIGAVSGVPSR